jgi:hypothetical protein
LVFPVPSDLDTEQPINWSKISKFILGFDLSFVVLNKRSRAASNSTVVDMGCEYDDASARVNVKYRRVSLGFSEAKFSECMANNLVPFAASLFEPVD